MSGLVQSARASSKWRRNYWKSVTLHGPGMEFLRLFRTDLDDEHELRTELRSRGRGFESSSGYIRLLYLVSRMDRNLLDYEKCSYEDLLKFCVRRGISASISRGKGRKKTTPVTNVLVKHPHISQFTRRHLISALENADEEANLSRFFDLPAELRCRIYPYSFSCFDLPTEPCIPPPIARASQLTRKESLPLFYQFHELVLRFDAWEEPRGRLAGQSARSFFTSFPHLAGLYRHIKLKAVWSYGGNLRPPKYSHWIVSLDIHGSGYKISLLENLAKYKQGLDKVVKDADAEVREMFREIANRVRGQKAIELEKEDWFALEDIFIRAHSQYNRRLAGNA